MNKIILINIFSILFIASGCSNRALLNNNPKKLNIEEIQRLNSILQEALDTITIHMNPEYEKETYSELPIELRTRLQNGIRESGLPIRSDSAFYLGFREAINNIKSTNLINKTYGLERLVNLNDNSTQWDADEVYRYILLNKYSIDTKIIAGCLVNNSSVAYSEGYNKIFIPVINKYYGFNVFEKAFSEISDIIENEGDNHKEWIYHERK